MNSESIRKAWSYALLALVVGLAYGEALRNGYVWDDRYFFLDYAWMDSFESAWRTAFSPLFNSRSYVRPLPLLSFYVEIGAAGRNPVLSHAVNIALHYFCTVIVFLLARRSIGDSGRHSTIWAFSLALLFAVHPALSETVIWVSSRFDLMATLFMLLALWLSGVERLSDWGRAMSIASLFFLAALCKESAASFPLVLAIYQVLAGGRSDRAPAIAAAFSIRNIKCYAAMILAGLAYLLIRRYVLGSGDGLLQGDFALEEHVARIAVALSKYLQLTLMPFVGNAPQHSFYWDSNPSIWAYLPQVVASGALLLVTAGLILRRKAAGWWLAAWLACFLPVLHLIPLPIGNNIAHQRFMYLGTAVLLALSPYAFHSITLSVAARRAAMVGLVGYSLLSVAVIRSVIPVWGSEQALWRWATLMDPRASEARENLIWVLLEDGQYEAAELELQKLMKDGIRTTANVAVNMGVANYRRSNFEQAKYYLEMAYSNQQSLLPSQRSSLASNLAATYALTGSPEKARSFISEALVLDPHNHTAIGNYLAFCRGKSVDVSRFGVDELTRARGVERSMAEFLNEKSIGSSACPQ